MHRILALFILASAACATTPKKESDIAAVLRRDTDERWDLPAPPDKPQGGGCHDSTGAFMPAEMCDATLVMRCVIEVGCFNSTGAFIPWEIVMIDPTQEAVPPSEKAAEQARRINDLRSTCLVDLAKVNIGRFMGVSIHKFAVFKNEAGEVYATTIKLEQKGCLERVRQGNDLKECLRTEHYAQSFKSNYDADRSGHCKP